MKGKMDIERQLSLPQPGDLPSGSALHIHETGIAGASGRKVVKKAELRMVLEVLDFKVLVFIVFVRI